MASLHLSSMWQARVVHKYCLSLRFSYKQQRPWIPATCKYSKTAGPVRYVPRSINLPKPTRNQDEHTDNGFDNHHEVEGTNKYDPSEVQQICKDTSLVTGCDHVRQKAETCAFFLEQENDMSRAFVKPQHVCESRHNDASDNVCESSLSYARDNADESRCNDARDLQRSSVNSADIYTKLEHMPRAVLQSSGRSPHPVGLPDSSDYFGSYKEQACARSGFVYEEDTAVATLVKTPHAAECKDKGARDSEGSSTDLSTNAPQARDKDTRSVFSSIKLSENWLYTTEEKVQTRETNLVSDVEKETLSQAFKTNPPLPVQGRHFRKREPDLQGRKVLPYEDVESFLLKVQKAKQRGLKPPGKPRVATSAVGGNLCVHDDNIDENDDIHDGTCLFLGQETDDCESEDSHGHSLFLGQEIDTGGEDVDKVESKSILSTSTVAQDHAKNQAIRYLAMRPYTGFQLRKKLEKQGISRESVNYALSIVQSCGLQSDLAYAETFSRARFNHGSWGPQRIKLGLKQRGISDEIIQSVLAMVFSEEKNDFEQYGASENCARSTSLKMSKVAMDHLLLQATKQWDRGRNVTHETKIRRTVSWLQYRGFNYSVIKTVLNHLQKKIRIEDEY